MTSAIERAHRRKICEPPPHDPWGDQRPAHQVIARDMPIGLRLKVGDVVKCALEVLHGELGWLGSTYKGLYEKRATQGVEGGGRGMYSKYAAGEP